MDYSKMTDEEILAAGRGGDAYSQATQSAQTTQSSAPDYSRMTDEDIMSYGRGVSGPAQTQTAQVAPQSTVQAPVQTPAQESERDKEWNEYQASQALDNPDDSPVKAGFRTFFNSFFGQGRKDAMDNYRAQTEGGGVGEKALGYLSDLGNSFWSGLVGGGTKIAKAAGQLMGNKDLVAGADAFAQKTAEYMPTNMTDTAPSVDENGNERERTWGQRIAQIGKDVMGVTGEFAPAMVPGYGSILLAAGGVNRYNDIVDMYEANAEQNGLSKAQSRAIGLGAAAIDVAANAFLMGKFRGVGKAPIEDKIFKSFMMRQLAGAIKTGIVMGGNAGVQESMNQLVQNGDLDFKKTGRVVADSVIEGALFHLMNTALHEPIRWSAKRKADDLEDAKRELAQRSQEVEAEARKAEYDGNVAKARAAVERRHAARVEAAERNRMNAIDAARRVLDDPQGIAMFVQQNPDLVVDIVSARRQNQDVDMALLHGDGVNSIGTIKGLGIKGVDGVGELRHAFQTQEDANRFGDRLLEYVDNARAGGRLMEARRANEARENGQTVEQYTKESDARTTEDAAKAESEKRAEDVSRANEYIGRGFGENGEQKNKARYDAFLEENGRTDSDDARIEFYEIENGAKDRPLPSDESTRREIREGNQDAQRLERMNDENRAERLVEAMPEDYDMWLRMYGQKDNTDSRVQFLNYFNGKDFALKDVKMGGIVTDVVKSAAEARRDTDEFRTKQESEKRAENEEIAAREASEKKSYSDMVEADREELERQDRIERARLAQELANDHTMRQKDIEAALADHDRAVAERRQEMLKKRSDRIAEKNEAEVAARDESMAAQDAMEEKDRADELKEMRKADKGRRRAGEEEAKEDYERQLEEQENADAQDRASEEDAARYESEMSDAATRFREANGIKSYDEWRGVKPDSKAMRWAYNDMMKKAVRRAVDAGDPLARKVSAEMERNAVQGEFDFTTPEPAREVRAKKAANEKPKQNKETKNAQEEKPVAEDAATEARREEPRREEAPASPDAVKEGPRAVEGDGRGPVRKEGKRPGEARDDAREGTQDGRAEDEQGGGDGRPVPVEDKSAPATDLASIGAKAKAAIDWFKNTDGYHQYAGMTEQELRQRLPMMERRKLTEAVEKVKDVLAYYEAARKAPPKEGGRFRGNASENDDVRFARRDEEKPTEKSVREYARRVEKFAPGMKVEYRPFTSEERAKAGDGTKASYNTETNTVVLTPSATVDDIAHEIGWHAALQYAKRNSPELLRKMTRFAADAPEDIKREVFRLYGNFKGEALLDEVGAMRFEREGGHGKLAEMFKAKANQGWFRNMLDGAVNVMRMATFQSGANLRGIKGMSPEEAMNRLAREFVMGRGLKADAMLQAEVMRREEEEKEGGDMRFARRVTRDGNTITFEGERDEERGMHAGGLRDGRGLRDGGGDEKMSFVERTGYKPSRIHGLFRSLNSDADSASLAERVFAAAESLGARFGFGDIRNVSRNGSSVAAERMGRALYDSEFFSRSDVSDQSKANKILHEAIHTVTSYALSITDGSHALSDVTRVNEGLRKATEELRSVYRQAKDKVGGAYGSMNEYEFVAELSNPSFRNELKRVDVWTKTVDAIKNVIDSVLGTKLSKTDANGAATKALYRMLENRDQEGFDAARRFAADRNQPAEIEFGSEMHDGGMRFARRSAHPNPNPGNYMDDTRSEKRKAADTYMSNMADRFHDVKRVLIDAKMAEGMTEKEAADWVQNSEESAYHAKRVQSGKAAVDVQLVEAVQKQFEDTLRGMRGKDLDVDDFGDYFSAMHAPARNAQKDRELVAAGKAPTGNGSGMTDAEANAVVNSYTREQLSRLEDARQKLVVRLNEKLGLDYLRKAGLIDEASVNRLKGVYGNDYVPFRDDVTEDGVDYNGTTSVSNPLMRAKGRDGSKAENPVAFFLLGSIRNVANAHENMTREKLAKFVEAHPEMGVVRKMTPMDRTGDNVISFRRNVIEDGVEKNYKYVIELHGKRGADLGRAFTEADLVRGPKWASAATRWFASFATQLSPTFSARNLVKDTMEVALDTMATNGAGAALKFLGAQMKYMPIWNREMRQVFREFRETGEVTGTSKMADDFRRFVKAGGLIGGGGAREGYAKEMESLRDITKRLGKAGETGRAVGRVWGAYKDMVSSLNESIENLTRFNNFRNRIHNGESDSEAVMNSREGSTDFGMYGNQRWMNSVWMFSSSILGGSMRAAKSMKYGKYGRRLVLGMFALGVLEEMADIAMNDGDDDERRKEGGAKGVSDYDRENSLHLRLGDKYVRVPVHLGPWSVLKYAGNHAARAAMGKEDWSEAADKVKNSVFTMLSHFSGTGEKGFGKDSPSLMNSMTPSVVQPFAQVYLNEDYKGDKIHRTHEWGKSKNMPDYMYAKEDTNRIFVELSRMLNNLPSGGGNDAVKGSFSVPAEDLEYLSKQVFKNFGTDTVNTLVETPTRLAQSAVTGENQFELRTTPFVKDFVKTVGRAGHDYYETLERVEREQVQFDALKTSAERREFVKEHPAANGSLKTLQQSIDVLAHRAKGQMKVGGKWVKANFSEEQKKRAKEQAERQMAKFVSLAERKR